MPINAPGATHFHGAALIQGVAAQPVSSSLSAETGGRCRRPAWAVVLEHEAAGALRLSASKTRSSSEGREDENRCRRVPPQHRRSRTFLATPVRHRVVGAKIATYLALGLLVAAVAAALQLAIVLPWAAANDHSPRTLERRRPRARSPAASSRARPTPRSVSASACSCATSSSRSSSRSAGSPSPRRRSRSLLPGVSRFLPGGALSGVDTDGLALLPLYTAVMLLAAYLATVSLLALRTALRRDIT